MVTPIEICYIVSGAAILLVFLAWGIGRINYYNGVIAGYGYARDPEDEKWKEAGEFLVKTCASIWPELERDFDEK